MQVTSPMVIRITALVVYIAFLSCAMLSAVEARAANVDRFSSGETDTWSQGRELNTDRPWPAALAHSDLENTLEVLLVMDPNGMLCWEDVAIDTFTNNTLLRWLHKQSDALTAVDSPGTSPSLKLPTGVENQTNASNFRELVEEAWQSHASSIRVPSQVIVAFQMTLLCEDSSHTPADLGFPCLDPTQLKLSHVDNFWKTVETSVAIGQLVLTGTEQPDITSSGIHAPLLQLDNTIIILPRVVTRVRPVHEHWEDHVYQDLAAWNVDFVIQMLQRFLQLSSAKTVPSLAEYRILPDKVKLQHMYQSHFEADPLDRTPPIPTAQVKLQHTQERERQLCYLAPTTPAEREDAKTLLLQAVLYLEHALPAEHPVRAMVQNGSHEWMGNYIIKREFSECSRHVFGVEIPNIRATSFAASNADNAPLSHYDNAAASMCSFDSNADSNGADNRSTVLSDNQNAASDSTVSQTARQPQPAFSSIWQTLHTLARLFSRCVYSTTADTTAASDRQAGATATLQPLIGHSADLSPDWPTCPNLDSSATKAVTMETGVTNATTADSNKMIAGLLVTPELDSLLDETADRLLHASCGEGWLLQPRIANMSGLEYRVYMLGGASMAYGSTEHNAVVYTPCLIAETGLHLYNFTLPQGMVCSDILPDLGDTPDNVVMTSYRPYELWSSPEVYEVILKAAQDGAEAITSSADGHVMRMVDNVMVRVDVVLGAIWDSQGQISLWPMVNEMDWFNSAGMLTSFWKDTVPFDNAETVGDDEVVLALRQSKGSRIAKGLLSEVLQTHRR